MSAIGQALAILKVIAGYLQRFSSTIIAIIHRFLKWWAAKAPGFFYSFWLHITLLIFLVGVPVSCQKEPLQQSVVTVELLPVKDVTNVKKKKAAEKKKKKEKVKEEPKKKKKAKVTPPPKPKPKPKAIPAPKPKSKPKVKPKPKPKPKPKEEPLDFNTVLKSVEKIKEKSEKEKKKAQKSTSFDPTIPLSISEIDAIKMQISKCWSIPAGARDAMDISVSIYMKLQKDGSITEVDITDKSRYSSASDPFYRAAADAALRAVRQCSPLKGLPPEKYRSWKEIELNFDPKEMLY